MSLAYLRDDPVVVPKCLYDGLLSEIRRRMPQKCFGYLLADPGAQVPSDFIMFEGNARNEEPWNSRFEARGQYFVEHDDAGFVATPEETWRVEREILSRGLEEVAVFHSHQRHPANFSSIDYELHLQNFRTLWHLIISIRNPSLPQVRAFAVSTEGVRERPLQLDPGPRELRNDTHEF